jgi:molybdate/tungstate transport system substrate-binding protein
MIPSFGLPYSIMFVNEEIQMFLNQRPSTHQNYFLSMANFFALILLFSLLLAACGSTTSGSATATPTVKNKISVLYAGSLVNLMEKKVGPAFTQATGYPYEGEGKGSTALATEIKGHLRTPDIFISAAATVDQSLMGSANGNYVSWYVPFTRTSIVIGYNDKSKFATDLQAAANGTKPWYQVLEEPGFRLGRTDPALDPKGARTIILMELAQQYYNHPNLSQKILGSTDNASQIFPEEELVARLGSGQLDAGFFYLNEVKEENLPYISLPVQINLGDPSYNSTYAKASYTNPKTGQITKGSATVYTITIPNTSKNKDGAIAFVNFLFSAQGKSILTQDGLTLVTPKVQGDATTVPSQVQQNFSS